MFLFFFLIEKLQNPAVNFLSLAVLLLSADRHFRTRCWKLVYLTVYKYYATRACEDNDVLKTIIM